VEEPEIVIEVTITWWHLLALAALVAAASAAIAYYPQLKLAIERDLLRTPLAEIKLGNEACKPGGLVKVEVCPAAELKGGDLTVMIVDPEGRVVKTAAFQAGEGCTALEVLLRSDSPAGTYTVIVRSGGRAVAAKRFEVTSS
jgi:hypothetical protein